MPVVFTSVYNAIAHGTPNWDAQLRTDVGNLGNIVNGATPLGSGKDLNGYNFQGVYFGSGFLNAPLGLADSFMVTCFATLDGATAVQVAYRMTSGSFASYRRYYVTGVGWTTWAAA
jgi:hypothetical protein